MSYDEFKGLCRKSWEEDCNYLYIDRSKKRDQGRIVFIKKAKTVILNVLRKQSLSENYNYAFTFTFFKCCMQLRIEKIWKN